MVEYEGPQLNFLYISLQDDTSLKVRREPNISSTPVLLPFFTAIPNWDISLVPKSRCSRISWMSDQPFTPSVQGDGIGHTLETEAGD